MIKKIAYNSKTSIILSKNSIQIKGPKGIIILKKPENLDIIQKNKNIYMKATNNHKKILKTYFKLILNNIKGVNIGYYKILKLIGIGYKASISNKRLQLKVGTSHNKIFQIPDTLKCYTYKNRYIIIYGINKIELNKTASEIKNSKKLDIYKGKGIREHNQNIILKQGKKK